MKTLPLIFLAATGLLVAAVVLAGCDRSMDDINPDPISDNQFNPATPYPSMMATGKSAVPEEGGVDTITGTDTIIEEDGVVADTEFEVNECIGSEVFCACFEDKGSDSKYTEYCNCIDSPSVPGGDNETYCGCCVFAFDPTFPEYDEQWQFLALGTCAPAGFEPPCQFD
jgi:hypothetical protein